MRAIGLLLLVIGLAVPAFAAGADGAVAATPGNAHEAAPAAAKVGAPAPAASAGNAAEAVAFYALALAAGLAAVGCVLTTNIVRMAVCLFVTLAAVALLYFLLAAGFLAVIQLIVYAGGTLIVIVFGVMLTSRTYGEKLRASLAGRLAGVVVGLALLAGLVALLVRENWAAPAAGSGSAGVPASFTVAEIGAALLAPYLLPFELASVLLLAVMIGAAYLASPVQRDGQ